MEIAAIISIVNEVLAVAQEAAIVGKDVYPILAKAGSILTKGTKATTEEVNELRTMSDALSAEIQQPLPPEEA